MGTPADLHRILQRQLRRLGLSSAQAPTSQQWHDLLAVISSSYHEADDDRYTLERSIEISSQEMRELHDGLVRQANHDGLTGLINRPALVSYLDSELGEMAADGRWVTVLYIDIDNFKLVNDSLGHSVGDQVLRRTGERICAAVHDDDVVARLGGDEFVVVCTNGEGVGAGITAARHIDEHMREPFHLGNLDPLISTSIGIAAAKPGERSSDDVLRQADVAMYEAKTRGRNRYVVFDEEMHRKIQGRLAAANDLRHAVTRDELVLHYQPVIRLGDRRVVAVESLVRWNRPGYGMMLPGSFIPLAEETGYITEIDAWVVDRACEAAARWSPDLSLAVNLSARDLQHSDLVSSIQSSLSRTGLPPERLILELTETAFLSTDAVVANTLARILRMGIRLAIDDFGTGYSSFASVRNLPAHVLKIDRSFVAAVDIDDSAAAVVAAIVDMAHALDLWVIAEGVERTSQAERLIALDCDAGQGHLFAAAGQEETLLANVTPVGRSATGLPRSP